MPDLVPYKALSSGVQGLTQARRGVSGLVQMGLQGELPLGAFRARAVGVIEARAILCRQWAGEGVTVMAPWAGGAERSRYLAGWMVSSQLGGAQKMHGLLTCTPVRGSHCLSPLPRTPGHKWSADVSRQPIRK